MSMKRFLTMLDALYHEGYMDHQLERGYDQRSNTAYRALLDELSHSEQRIAELESQIPRWIPVTERLPDNSCHVLVFCTTNTVEKTFFTRDIDFLRRIRRVNNWVSKDETASRYFNLHHKYGYSITHWMRLPSTPEVKKNGSV